MAGAFLQLVPQLGHLRAEWRGEVTQVTRIHSEREMLLISPPGV